MTGKTRTDTAPLVEFIQYHQPPLDSGTYRVDLTQSLQTLQSDKVSTPATWERSLTFVVTGERFTALAPSDVAGVFPPEGSLGDHLNVLPHITLTRSTLPWERSPDNEDPNLPWLALLLFRESDFTSPEDKPVERILPLRELTSAPGATFPPFEEEVGQDPDDSVSVIEVKRRLLEAVLPKKSELGYLAHVRQLKGMKKEDPSASTNTHATVLCNRLPQEGGTSTVYLVSVEGRYHQDSEEFDFGGAGEEALIRLVSLKRWSFSCLDPDQSFTALLSKVKREPSTLRLTEEVETEAAPYLARGCVPLPHALRQGDKTVSWYHGPLSPGDVQEPVALPALAADELLRYEARTGMFDVSYASAWELGRRLTLRNQAVSLALYQWKRTGRLAQRQEEQRLRTRSVSRMPFRSVRTPPGPPEVVRKWFEDLRDLRGVPFEYLVPDARLLPAESLRFFRMDWRWMKCLLDGANSIGRVTEADRRLELRRRSASPLEEADRLITGFLLRSSVVSGWKDLLVDGYDVLIEDNTFQPPESMLNLARMERLNDNVLLCLFEGDVKTVDIHLQPEAMHFGVDAPVDEAPRFRKTPRDRETGSEILERQFPVPWKKDEALGVIHMGELAQKLQNVQSRSEYTSAPLALQMIEGVQKVRFSQVTP
ncbi:hypothetical protein D187_008474 [Cystobacter fuscus DSM 2262]|uniref:Uncharacterized protein n=1 Tax=Cystobacter fuscus (strain ATCC 25194 / DSM 2262 / NBRC 100088 / M29) TaxID=1242864 RepID=S9PIQ1_CYSF2|nr:hypothetical protein [Cystobacter fuscus]EPX62287.1 hypothetical protein D187_008474 [Cystobacter fuscus DSM 2262]